VQAAPATPAEFPFQFREGLLWIEVKVPQSAKPLNFLLDTGAGVSVINLTTAKRLGLNLAERVNVRGVGSVTEGYWPQRLSAKLGEVTLPKEFLAVDLGELSKVCECCVDGLLGVDFFQGRAVQIDFQALKARLVKSGAVPANATVLALRSSSRSLLAPVQINDSKPQWMRLDTGCVSALQWVAKGARPVGTKAAVSVGLTELNIPTTPTRVRLGAEEFESVPTGLHDSEIFSGEAGLLGNGLLSEFERVTIDTKASRLVLQGRRTKH
jgi:hypothetical protein